MSKSTICLDFDGVIHWYRYGYDPDTYDPAIIEDIPVPGAADAISRLREHYRVVVFSVRSRTLVGRDAILDWLWEYQIQVDDVCATKPAAVVYIDDRGIQFNGDWKNTLEEIGAYENWLHTWREPEVAGS